MKTCLTCLLACILVVATLAHPVAASQNEAQTSAVESVKIKIAKLGIGAKAKATVFLKDGTKKKGYIAQAGDDNFVLRDRKTDAPTTIGYNEVAKVDSNRGHSTARNIAVGVTVGVVSVLTVLAVIIAKDN